MVDTDRFNMFSKYNNLYIKLKHSERIELSFWA